MRGKWSCSVRVVRSECGTRLLVRSGTAAFGRFIEEATDFVATHTS